MKIDNSEGMMQKLTLFIIESMIYDTQMSLPFSSSLPYPALLLPGYSSIQLEAITFLSVFTEPQCPGLPELGGTQLRKESVERKKPHTLYSHVWLYCLFSSLGLSVLAARSTKFLTAA